MRRTGKRVMMAAGTTVLALAAHGTATWMLRTGVDQRLAALSGPSVSLRTDSIDVDPWSGRVTLRGLTVDSASGPSVRVGRVDLTGTTALVSPALAAGNVVLENVSVSWNGLSYAMPRVEAVGSSLGDAELRAIFESGDSKSAADRIAALSAESISIPELRTTSTLPDSSGTFIYRDLRFVGIASGVIRSMAASGGTFASQGKNGETLTGTLGAMAVTQLDVPWIVRTYTQPAGPNDTQPRLAYGSFSLENMAASIQDPAKKGVAKFAIGRMVGKDIKVRPTREPWLPLVQEFANKPDAERRDLPPADRVRLVNGIVDMFDAVQTGLIEMSDMTFTGPDTASGGDVTVKVARMAYSGAQVGKPNDTRLEGIEMIAKDGNARIGSFSQTGWSFQHTLEGVRNTVGKLDFDPSTIDPRMFLPDFGTYTLRDVDLNVPDTRGKPAGPFAAGGPRIRIGLKQFELQATSPLNGIPTVVRTSFDRFTMALPANATEDGLKDLVAMGYRELDLSFAFDARWRESDQTIAINDIGIQGVNMGGVSLRGAIANIPPDVFTGDATMAQIALFGATVKQVTLTVDNKGLFEKALDREAKRRNKSADQIRRELGAGAQMLVPAFLGASGNGKAVAAAVAKFIAKPVRLTVTAVSKDPSGLGAADVMAASGDPASLIGKIDITAVAD